MPLIENDVTSRDSFTEIDIERTRQAFDAAAPVYDAAYEGLPGIQRIRSVTSGLYLRYFPAGGRLLEINCGTGNDAIFLARHGMNVLATDLSPGMVRETAEKTERAALRRCIETRELSFDQLGELSGMTFDGAYSNLGGLNCTERLASVAADLGRLLRPGACLIATVMPSFCLWETLSSLLRFRWRQAFRRQARGGTVADLHGGRVRTYYHSPHSFRAAFGKDFEHVRTIGLAILTPPPNFIRAYTLLGDAISLLERVDDVVAGFPPFASIGDHYAIVLRRKDR
jgi:SAM-dependent methyltransferase